MIVQIKSFVRDKEYVKEAGLPFGATVTTKSIESKINEFLIDNKISVVHDIKFDTYQGETEALMIYSIDEIQD
jgi:MoaA/NifB/PqqE/SkfB family radical SAM enzyme